MNSIGIFEIKSWSAGMVALDAMTKAASIRVLQAELNDMMAAAESRMNATCMLNDQPVDDIGTFPSSASQNAQGRSLHGSIWAVALPIARADSISCSI